MSQVDPVIVYGDSYILKTDAVHQLQDKLHRYEDALKDLSRGARMMLEAPLPALHLYAGEVKRVAGLALNGTSDG